MPATTGVTSRPLASTLAAAALASVLVVAPGAGGGWGSTAAYGAVESDCDRVGTQPGDYGTVRESVALEEMDVARATRWLGRRSRQPGEGVVVAVVDSGVGAPGAIDVVERPQVVEGLELRHYHGTAVAGLIAGAARPEDQGGAVGIAPAAQVLDLAVYDDPTGQNGTTIQTANVVKALDVVLDRVRAGMNVRVVNISLNVEPDAEPDGPLQQRIDALWEAGVVTVAPTGNRPRNETESVLVPDEFDDFTPGENAVAVVHPAGYEHVVGVNASMTGLDDVDPHDFVLENSATDVAAPTAPGVSYTIAGGTCLLSVPATSWAAAEVSGVLAMLFSRFPDDTAAMAVSRLELTANGRADIANWLLGAGEVQPYDALTRPLALDPDGNAEQTAPQVEEQVYSAPEPEPDVLASTRRNAVWWGLVGGGALLLALVVRPVLARRPRRR